MCLVRLRTGARRHAVFSLAHQNVGGHVELQPNTFLKLHRMPEVTCYTAAQRSYAHKLLTCT